MLPKQGLACMFCCAQGKFQPVDQVVMDEDFPACTRLLSCTRSLATLRHVAEEKGNMNFFFNQFKIHALSPEDVSCSPIFNILNVLLNTVSCVQRWDS